MGALVFNEGSGNKKDNRHWTYPAQGFLEFVLILPLLLVIIVTALELGRVFFAKIIITNAAREGAYYLSLHKDDSNVCDGSLCYLNTRQSVMDEANNSGITLQNNEITVSSPCCTPGEPAQVNISTTVENLWILSIFQNGIGVEGETTSFSISSSVNMVVQ